MNTVTCLEYSCEILVDITLHFELQKNVAMCIGLKTQTFCQKFFFFV
jgi:hypothetical protein